MEQRLAIRQSQQMVLTPQMQQSIKILQLPSLELEHYLTELVETNPFLDLAAPENEVTSPQDSSSSEEHDASQIFTQADEDSGYTDGKASLQTEENQSTDRSSDQHLQSASSTSTDQNNNWSDDAISPAIYEPEEHSYQRTSSHMTSDAHQDYINQLDEPEETLRAHIEQQIPLICKEPADRLIALHLLDSLDDNGYCSADQASLAEQLKCDTPHIESVRVMLTQCEPVGVFACNLAECLRLQLEDLGGLTPSISRLLGHLDILAKGEMPRLARICRVSLDQLYELITQLKTLNPRPASLFGEKPRAIEQPDIFLTQRDGAWRVELNSNALPRVLVNRTYAAQIRTSVKNDKESQKFISEHLNSANWLTKALDQRANTIVKIAQAIVKEQELFFTLGICHLRPLVLSDIASLIDMHESTVSRVVNGKYMATPMGMYELKYFFTSSLGGSRSAGGENDISSRTVKHLITQLVANEKPTAILSDDKLTKALQEQGITVARRTVMKYREALKIPSSVERRRMKKMEAR